MTDNITPAYRIHTNRLVLRCWEPTDAALQKDAIDTSREFLKPWMPWAYSGPDPLETIIQRLRVWRGKFDLDQEFVYGIFSEDEKQVLGGTGLHTRVGDGALEIGYWVHVDHIGQGFATETAAALTRVAFEIHKVDRVEIHCEPANIASAAIPKKLGFVHEGTLRQRGPFLKEKPRDSMIWTMLRSEYSSSQVVNTEIEAFDAIGGKLI